MTPTNAPMIAGTIACHSTDAEYRPAGKSSTPPRHLTFTSPPHSAIRLITERPDRWASSNELEVTKPMHGTMRSYGTPEQTRGIRGVFYPSDDRADARSFVPKVIATLVAMALVRTVISRHHGGGRSSGWSRRREMIAELHRELHAQEDATPAAGGTPAKA